MAAVVAIGKMGRAACCARLNHEKARPGVRLVNDMTTICYHLCAAEDSP